MAEKIVWEDGADVTAEDIAAALKPLVDEYFLGTCEQQGAALCYTLPDGRKLRQGRSVDLRGGRLQHCRRPLFFA